MQWYHAIKKKFKPVIHGINYMMDDSSIRLQCMIAIIILVVSYLFSFNIYEYIYVIVSCGLVITIEIINSSIETIVDKISCEKNEQSKKIKDLSATAVFVISISVAIGYILILKGKFL